MEEPWLGECSKDRTVGQMGGVRGAQKVRPTAEQAPWGSSRRTRTYTDGRGGLSGTLAGQQVPRRHTAVC